MSNVAKALKAEISRISRREAKSAVDPIAKTNTALKKIISDLKARVAALEKECMRMLPARGKEKAETPPGAVEETRKSRFTSKGVRSLRNKLGLSQAAFAKLVGVTTHAVYLWETKEGTLNLRDKTRETLLSIKGLRAREAKEKLAQGETGSDAPMAKTKTPK